MIKKIMVIFAVLLISGCDYMVGLGIIKEKRLVDNKAESPVYLVTILDEGCNCERLFQINRYDNWVKFKINERVQIRQFLTGRAMQESK